MLYRTRKKYSPQQRAEMWDRWQRGDSLNEIGRAFDRPSSTISREINRNGGYDHYRATQAEQAAWVRTHRPKKCKLACHPMLKYRVATKLKRNWSPKQISGWLKRTYPKQENKQVSHETIYRSLFIQARGVL